MLTNQVLDGPWQQGTVFGIAARLKRPAGAALWAGMTGLELCKKAYQWRSEETLI
jgi:hypothetical protein